MYTGLLILVVVTVLLWWLQKMIARTRQPEGSGNLEFQASRSDAQLARADVLPMLSGNKKLSGFRVRSRLGPGSSTKIGTHEPDPAYELQPGIREALTAVDSGAPIVFVLGRAGTGKTTLIHHIMRTRDVRQVALAPTGVAALNVGGQTIHSFFHFPPQLLDPQSLEDGKPRRIWRAITRIIIDEVSMVRADVLDAIDWRLRKARCNDRPFGDVQMVFVGDFLQLPPVVPEDERTMLARLGYESAYAFSARSIADISARFVHLPNVMRQSDPGFIELLSALRNGPSVDVAVKELNQRCCRAHREGVTPIVLTGTNARADHYNRAGLEAINAPETAYLARVTGTFEQRRDRLPASELLSLKPGARVMAVKNDKVERRWVNGSLGTVDRLAPHRLWVRFDHSSAVDEIERQTWENIRYHWNEKEGRVETQVVGSFEQFPLALAWASTVHKAQGLSLDDLRIDLESGAFASGQAYVAVSRARSFAGLSMAHPLRATDFFVDQLLLDFERWSQSPESLSS